MALTTPLFLLSTYATAAVSVAAGTPCVDEAHLTKRLAEEGVSPALVVKVRPDGEGLLVEAERPQQPRLRRKIPVGKDGCAPVERVLVALVSAWAKPQVTQLAGPRPDGGAASSAGVPLAGATPDAGTSADSTKTATAVVAVGGAAATKKTSGSSGRPSDSGALAAQDRTADGGRPPAPGAAPGSVARGPSPDGGRTPSVGATGAALAVGGTATASSGAAPSSDGGAASASNAALGTSADGGRPPSAIPGGVALTAAASSRAAPSSDGGAASVSNAALGTSADGGRPPSAIPGGVALTAAASSGAAPSSDGGAALTSNAALGTSADGGRPPSVGAAGAALAVGSTAAASSGVSDASASNAALGTSADAGRPASSGAARATSAASVSAQAEAPSEPAPPWGLSLAAHAGVSTGPTPQATALGSLMVSASRGRWGLALEAGLESARTQTLPPGSVWASSQWVSVGPTVSFTPAERWRLDVLLAFRLTRLAAGSTNFLTTGSAALAGFGAVANGGVAWKAGGPVWLELRAFFNLRAPVERFTVAGVEGALELGLWQVGALLGARVDLELDSDSK